jgi:hypothetical protein
MARQWRVPAVYAVAVLGCPEPELGLVDGGGRCLERRSMRVEAALRGHKVATGDGKFGLQGFTAGGCILRLVVDVREVSARVLA